MFPKLQSFVKEPLLLFYCIPWLFLFHFSLNIIFPCSWVTFKTNVFEEETLCHYHNGKTVSLGKWKVTINKPKTVIKFQPAPLPVLSIRPTLSWLRGEISKRWRDVEGNIAPHWAFLFDCSEGLRKNWKENNISLQCKETWLSVTKSSE